MTTLLEQAIKKASSLPADEQDTLAAVMLEEITSEAEWDALFAGSQDALAKLGAAAIAEHRAGRTSDFDPDREI